MRPENMASPMETKQLVVSIVAYTDGIYTIVTQRPDQPLDSIYTLTTDCGPKRTAYELMDQDANTLAVTSFESIEAINRPSYAIGWALTCALAQENGLRLPLPRNAA